MQRKSGAHELLDGPLDPRTLAGNLRDLTRVNRWLGGVELSWRALEPLLRAHEPDRPLRFLDVGTGAADIPRALLLRAEEAGHKLEIVATDVRTEIVALAAAQKSLVGQPSLQVKLGSVGRIGEADDSFDIAHASLVLHHLDEDAAVGLLAKMGRVASGVVIINDLDRAQRWFIAAKLLTRLSTRNSYTRHDGPLSVERAYRPNELTQLAARAGLVEEGRYWARPPYRYAITFRTAARE